MLRTCCLTLLLGSIVLCGCPSEDYPDVVSLTQPEVSRILDDETLDPQERREQLEAAGLTPATINILMRDQTIANQFGGHPRSAYQKVADGQLRQLTPDEVQIYASMARNVDNSLAFDVADEQAQVVVDLFVGYQLTSRESLDALLKQTDIVIPAIIPEGMLNAVFVEFDPQRLLPNLP